MTKGVRCYAFGYSHGPRYFRLSFVLASGSPMTTSFAPSQCRLRPSLARLAGLEKLHAGQVVRRHGPVQA